MTEFETLFYGCDDTGQKIIRVNFNWQRFRDEGWDVKTELLVHGPLEEGALPDLRHWQ